MRINVYSQELVLDEPIERAAKLVAQHADTDVTYTGVRMFLHSSERLHDRLDDDDRSAITFWLPKSETKRKALSGIFEELAALILLAPSETGLD